MTFSGTWEPIHTEVYMNTYIPVLGFSHISGGPFEGIRHPKMFKYSFITGHQSVYQGTLMVILDT